MTTSTPPMAQPLIPPLSSPSITLETPTASCMIPSHSNALTSTPTSWPSLQLGMSSWLRASKGIETLWLMSTSRSNFHFSVLTLYLTHLLRGDIITLQNPHAIPTQFVKPPANANVEKAVTKPNPAVTQKKAPLPCELRLTRSLA